MSSAPLEHSAAQISNFECCACPAARKQWTRTGSPARLARVAQESALRRGCQPARGSVASKPLAAPRCGALNRHVCHPSQKTASDDTDHGRGDVGAAAPRRHGRAQGASRTPAPSGCSQPRSHSLPTTAIASPPLVRRALISAALFCCFSCLPEKIAFPESASPCSERACSAGLVASAPPALRLCARADRLCKMKHSASPQRKRNSGPHHSCAPRHTAWPLDSRKRKQRASAQLRPLARRLTA